MIVCYFQVTNYNRVMLNHRSVTKPKDVKYKRINKAKSKSLEELRGRLKNLVERPPGLDGGYSSGMMPQTAQSYAWHWQHPDGVSSKPSVAKAQAPAVMEKHEGPMSGTVKLSPERRDSDLANSAPGQEAPAGRHGFPKRSLTLPRILVPRQSMAGLPSNSGGGGGGGASGGGGRGGF